MRKILDLLFIKDEPINEAIFCENLFASYDKLSALRADYKTILEQTKIYNNYHIIKMRTNILQEGYKEYLTIIKVSDKNLFIRIITITEDTEKIYDFLIYSLNDESKYHYYENIFFKQLYTFDFEKFALDLKTPKTCIFKYEQGHLKIQKANESFYQFINYEDWDFENKHQNCLEVLIKEDPIALINEQIKTITFKIKNKEVCSSYSFKKVDNYYTLTII